MRVSLVLMPNYMNETPSLGLAYLYSSLIECGHEVSRIEFNLSFRNKLWIRKLGTINSIVSSELERYLSDYGKEKETEKYFAYCVSRILQEKPAVVGFSLYSLNWVSSAIVASKLREKDSNIRIVYGGPTLFFNRKISERLLQLGIVDYIVIGEGEKSLPTALQNDRIKEIPGIMYLDGTKIICNDWVPEEDIDSLPYPLFNSEAIQQSLLPYRLPIITSRGCRYQCKFCSQKHLWKGFRQRRVSSVVDEIKYQSKMHQVYDFRFNDSLLNGTPGYVERLSSALMAENTNIVWGGNMRIDRGLSRKSFKKMYNGGCRYIYFGVESASPSVLNRMGKFYDIHTVEENLRAAHDANIWTHVYLMVGYIRESYSDFQKTIKFIMKNKQIIDSFMINIYNEDLVSPYNKGVRLSDLSVGRQRLQEAEKIFDKSHYYGKVIDENFQKRYDRINNQKNMPNRIYL